MKQTDFGHIPRTFLFIARWTRLPHVFVLILATYVAFWLLTYQRLHNPGLRARMMMTARILTLPKNATTAAVTATLDDVAKSAAVTGLSFGFRDSPFGDATTTQDLFVKQASRLAELDPTDHRFKEVLYNLDGLGIYWSDSPVGEPGFWQRFKRDYFSFSGASFRIPYGVKDARQNAHNFLTYCLGIRNPNAVPLIDRVRLWSLIAFYDWKRAVLNDDIPLAMGIMALGCGFFLRFLYVDFEIDGWRGSPVVLRKERDWIPIWQESVSPLIVRRFFRSIPDIVVLGCALLAVVAELSLNDPEMRTEWLVNVPLMGLTAGLVVTLCYVLVRLASLRPNTNLAEYSRDFRQRVFRPLRVAIPCSSFPTIWMIYFSAAQLLPAPNSKIEGRAIGQLALGVVILFLLTWLFIRLNSELRRIINSPKTGPGAKLEAELNRSSSGLHYYVFGSIDERFISAACLVLLPLPSILKWAMG